jgi:hypothetical protein
VKMVSGRTSTGAFGRLLSNKHRLISAFAVGSKTAEPTRAVKISSL